MTMSKALLSDSVVLSYCSRKQNNTSVLGYISHMRVNILTSPFSSGKT